MAGEAVALWEQTEANCGRRDTAPPFWGFAWAGGQALARYIIDRPATVAGHRVLDFASGSGLCALAAAKAGAAVQAADIDPYAAAAIALNAEANAVAVEVVCRDLVGVAGPWTMILAGDISYQKDLAERVYAWLSAEARRGVAVLIGDPARAYLPRSALRELAAYDVPVLPGLEDAARKASFVFAMEA